MKTATDLAWEEICQAAEENPVRVSVSVIHPFTKTLGEGPYSFVSLTHGSTKCSHCGTPIKNLYNVKNGIGTILPVGSECILQLNHSDTNSLVRQVKSAKSKYDSMKREAAKAKKLEKEKLENLEISKKEFPEVIDFLEKNFSGNGFYNSLYNQLNTYGTLSERQVECIKNAIEKAGQPVAPLAEKEYSLKSGQTIIVSKFIARILGAEFGLNRPHFALEVVKVTNESAKSYEGIFKISAVRTVHCCVCGITLSNPASIAAGIGPICASKYEVSSVEELSEKFTSITTELKRWIPKSQIKEVK